MIKGICLVFLFSSCVLFGLYCQRSAQKNIRILEEAIFSLELLTREIEYSLTPLGEAFLKVSKMINGELSECFLKISSQMLTPSRPPFSSIYKEEMGKLIKSCSLSEREREILLSLKDTLGKDDYSGQIKTLSIAKEKLSFEVKWRKEGYERHEKLYSRMGILIGLLLVTVLL